MKNFWNFGNGFCGLLILLVMLLLGGCASPDSAVTKVYEIDMETDNGSNVVILVLDADVDSNTSVKQDAKADARTQVDAALSQPGKITEAADVAKGLLDAGKVPAVVVVPDKDAVPVVEKVEAKAKPVSETGIYHGRTNGDRPTWYFSKSMAEYPSDFDITIPGCKTISVTGNNGVRFDAGGGNIVKQSDVPGRRMAVLASASCASTVARI